MRERARPAPPWRDDSHPPWWHPNAHAEGWYPPGHWAGGRRSRRFGRGRWMRGPGSGRPLRRNTEERMAGGVAAGLATRTGFDPTTVRIVFVVATLLSGGFFAVFYVFGWLVVPADGDDTAIVAKAVADRRGIALAMGIISLLVVLAPLAGLLRIGWLQSFVWPLCIGSAGLVLIWRNAPASEQEVVRRLAEPWLGIAAGTRRRGLLVRLVLALILVAAGVNTLQSAHENLKLLRPLAGVLLVISAIAVLLGPWWLRIARALVIERQARIRAEERADIASRVHDSVLQTLALIQRNAGNPQQVIKYARAQERELRSWLFDGRPPGSIGDQAATFTEGVRLIQQEVEAQHGVSVEAVTVGDCDLNEDLTAMLAAAREATVNAAKWSGTTVVSLFAEVEPAAVSLFVRDRGKGFDPAAVPGDRKGVAESIRGRMARRGGTATVRSAPGEGTEVALTMPRTAAS